MNNNLRTQLFIEKAQKMHDGKFDYSKFEYINMKTKGIIICPVHEEFKQTPEKHIANNSKGCPLCWVSFMKGKKKYRTKEKPIMNVEDFLGQCKNKYGDKYTYDISLYTGKTKNKIKICCPIHGDFYQTPINHLQPNNKTGCKSCGVELKNKSKTKSYMEFVQKANNIFCNIYTYDDLYNKLHYVNRKSKVSIICDKHGQFYKNAQKHLSGQGCFKCKIEELINLKVLVGGYNNILFDRNPELKYKPALLYYIKADNVYKIGITTNIKSRLRAIKAKSKSSHVNLILSYKNILWEVYKREQTILNTFSHLKATCDWSSETFAVDIRDGILTYFS